MNKIIRTRLLYFLFAALMMVAFVGCEQDPEWTKPDTSLEPATPAIFINDVVMPDATDMFIPKDEVTIKGTGFDKFDVFIFRSKAATKATEEIKYYQAKIVAVEATQVTIQIPDKIELLEYQLVLKRFDKEQVLGEMTIYKAHFPPIEDIPGMNVKGRVFCGKVPVKGVVVSDGIITTITDEKGVYYLGSNKKMGYVFISVPSGYNAETEAGYPAFPMMHQQLVGGDEVEQRDFALTEVVGGNTNHTMMVFTDLHLADKTPNTANKYRDIDQYKTEFLPDVIAEMAQHPNVYALCLGDITWDAFWYKNMTDPSSMVEVRYQLPEYKELMKSFPCQVFNVIGNHDNDPKVIGDFLTEGQFKREIAPTYYSFNIGDIHYIVLDNDQYDNYNGGNRIERVGLNGASDPQKWQMKWLEEDLKYVEKSKKVVIAMHAPLTSASLTPSVTLPGGSDMVNLLNGYNVEILSGHTHNNHHAVVSPTIREHNVAAVCGTWWFNVKSNNGAPYSMCRDGSPIGYGVFSFAGTQASWYYKGIGVNRDEQMAIYDMNAVKKAYQIATGAKANEVLVNIWNWDEDWTVVITENDTPLTSTRVNRRDPVHYTWQKDVLEPAHAPGSPNSTYLTTYSAHMFSVIATIPGSLIKVVATDPFGRTYQKQITRAVPTSSFPAMWTFAADVGKDGFETLNAMPSTTGKATLGYTSNCDAELDINKKIARILGGTGEPYITGGWPEDYWLYKVSDVTIDANTTVKIKFATKSSATGMKYWMLEYLDGGEWKSQGEVTTETIPVLGEVSYTQQMNADGKTNVIVDEDIVFTKAITNGDLQIRFRCVANWQASGKGGLLNPNGGTHRMAVQDLGGGEMLYPTIEVVE